jgi:hypothetical protein
MVKRLAALGLLLAACFAPRYEDGHLLCAPGNVCPQGFHCAVDHTCWHDGADPAAVPLVFVSSGGGPVTAPSGRQLNLSIGGSICVGTVTAPSGASFTAGALVDDTL